MGTWSPDILGSDGALDALGDIGDFLNLGGECDLYPMEYKPRKRAKIRAQINAKIAQDISGFRQYLLTAGEESTPLVAAALIMYVGADFPEDIRDIVIFAINTERAEGFDGWGEQFGAERREIIIGFLTRIAAYEDGNPVEMTNRGLFEMMATKMSDRAQTPHNQDCEHPRSPIHLRLHNRSYRGPDLGGPH